MCADDPVEDVGQRPLSLADGTRSQSFFELQRANPVFRPGVIDVVQCSRSDICDQCVEEPLGTRWHRAYGSISEDRLRDRDQSTALGTLPPWRGLAAIKRRQRL